MTLSEIKDAANETVTVVIDGSVDTVTSPDLENFIQDYYKQVKKIILDFSKVDYISSAGLRVLLRGDAEMGSNGSFIIKNPLPDVMEIMDMTGFSNILTIIKD